MGDKKDGKGPKEKKEKDDKDKKKTEINKLFGEKISIVPGPGTYDHIAKTDKKDKEYQSTYAKLTQGHYNTGTGMIRRDIIRGNI